MSRLVDLRVLCPLARDAVGVVLSFLRLRDFASACRCCASWRRASLCMASLRAVRQTAVGGMRHSDVLRREGQLSGTSVVSPSLLRHLRALEVRRPMSLRQCGEVAAGMPMLDSWTGEVDVACWGRELKAIAARSRPLMLPPKLKRLDISVSDGGGDGGSMRPATLARVGAILADSLTRLYELTDASLRFALSPAHRPVVAPFAAFVAESPSLTAVTVSARGAVVEGAMRPIIDACASCAELRSLTVTRELDAMPWHLDINNHRMGDGAARRLSGMRLGVSADVAVAVGRCLASSRSLTSVDLAYCLFPLCGYASVGDHLPASTVSSLRLSFLDFGDGRSHTSVLAAVSRAPSLTALRLTDCGVDAVGALRVAEAVARSSALRSVDLRNNPFAPSCAMLSALDASDRCATFDVRMGRAPCPRLLGQQTFGDDADARPLFDDATQRRVVASLHRWRPLTEVDGSKLSAANLHLIAPLIDRHRATVKRVVIRDPAATARTYNPSFAAAVNAPTVNASHAATMTATMVSIGATPALTSLTVSAVFIPFASLLPAISPAWCATLTSLSLSRCGLYDNSCAALGSLLRRCSQLSSVDLSGNHIGTLGSRDLSAALRHSPSDVRRYDVSDNHIGDIGATELVDAVEQRRTMREVQMDDNDITREWIAAMSQRLKNDNFAMRRLKMLRQMVKVANT